jgi:hypothetical protein
VRDCHLACDLVEIDISGHASTPHLHLVDANFAGADALSAASGFRPIHLPTQFLRVERAPDAGIVLSAGRVHAYLGSMVGTYRTGVPAPAVSTPGASYVLSTGPPAIPSIDGSDQPIRVVARVPVLPFVGTSGSVLDLRSTLRGARSSVPTTDAVVVARADTPAPVLSALRSYHGVGNPTTFSAAVERLAQTPRAQGTRLYVLVAVFAAIIAVLALAAGVAQQRVERRVEAASLRSAGVRARQINDAYRTEVLVLGSATLIGTAIACWASCKALLGSLPLVSGWAFAPPLDASPRTLWVLVCSVGAAVSVVGIGYLAFRRIGRASAPRLLREDIA